MIKAIIFDMDGTIINTEFIKENGWKYAGNYLGIKIDEEILSEIRGTGKENIKEYLINKFGKSFDFDKLYELREFYIEKYIEENGITMKKGLIETLDFLKINNYKIALASSSRMEKIKKYLDMLNILDYFDVLVSNDMVEKGKPNPDIYLQAIKFLNVSKDECIAIEDNVNGILSIHSAGIKPILIPDLEQNLKRLENISYIKLNSILEIVDLIKQAQV